ncbi:MAG: TetR/AcrR family transcriptional regulator [Bacteroidota bacterium]
MATAATKAKIKQAAVQLFNQDGMANVRLQSIADEAVVSVGNLTYHYRNKELLIEAIWEEILSKRKTLLAEFRVLPLFEDLERQIRAVFQIQQDYQFFYIDTLDLIRSFPGIASSWRAHQQWQTTALKNTLDFSVSRAVFAPEFYPGFFNHLAEQYWLVSDGWIGRQRSLGRLEDDFQAYHAAIWQLLYPLLTVRGRQEYEQTQSLIQQGLL